jgi:hypothetical protein
MPSAGAHFSTNDLLNVVTEYPPLRPTDIPGPLSTRTALDPGVHLSARYMYAVTRKLALELEASWGVAVHVIEQIDLTSEAEQPQIESTTTDAHILQYFLNMSYFMGPYYVTSPYVTIGFGSRSTDLRQKGPINPDPIYNRTYMAGLGVMAVANETLAFRLELRDYMYNFFYDNQFADPNLSHAIIGERDIGIAVAEAEPRFQHDMVVTFGVQVRMSF